MELAAHARSAQDCVLVGFEQLQDNLPGQLGPFPDDFLNNKLRASFFWTGVLHLGFFPPAKMGFPVFQPVPAACCPWPPLRGRLCLLLVLM